MVEEGKINIGNVAKCSRDRVGVITEITVKRVCLDCDGFTLYKGIGFDGKEWQSTSPQYIAANVEEYLNKISDPYYDYPHLGS